MDILLTLRKQTLHGPTIICVKSGLSFIPSTFVFTQKQAGKTVSSMFGARSREVKEGNIIEQSLDDVFGPIQAREKSQMSDQYCQKDNRPIRYDFLYAEK